MGVRRTNSNVGNSALDNVTLQLLAVDPTTSAVLNTYQETVALSLGQSITRTTVFNASGLSSGPTLLVLLGSTQGVTQTLATGGVTITGGAVNRLYLPLVTNGPSTAPNNLYLPLIRREP